MVVHVVTFANDLAYLCMCVCASLCPWQCTYPGVGLSTPPSRALSLSVSPFASLASSRYSRPCSSIRSIYL